MAASNADCSSASTDKVEQPAPETPINIKRNVIRQTFMSPTDNFMSPCTAQITAAHSKQPKCGLLRQTFKVPPPVYAKENSEPEPQQGNAAE